MGAHERWRRQRQRVRGTEANRKEGGDRYRMEGDNEGGTDHLSAHVWAKSTKRITWMTMKILAPTTPITTDTVCVCIMW